MAIQFPTLPVVLITAIIDSINPCAIGVLILLVTTLLTLHKNRNKMLTVGSIYILVVYITYFLAGIGLLFFIQKLNIAKPLGIFVGALIIILGLIELKDFWWYGKGISLSIPARRAEQIKKYTKKITIPVAIFLGFFVAAVELPCTGGPYLAITLLLSQSFNLTAVWLLVIYNIIFVMPLIIILCMVLAGKKVVNIKRWKQASRGYIRLITGLILIWLGWMLILIANGTINLG